MPETLHSVCGTWKSETEKGVTMLMVQEPGRIAFQKIEMTTYGSVRERWGMCPITSYDMSRDPPGFTTSVCCCSKSFVIDQAPHTDTATGRTVMVVNGMTMVKCTDVPSAVMMTM